MGSPTAMLARKMLAAKGTDNRQIADGNIALLLLPFRETTVRHGVQHCTRARFTIVLRFERGVLTND
jgi:hypothetical protein